MELRKEIFFIRRAIATEHGFKGTHGGVDDRVCKRRNGASPIQLPDALPHELKVRSTRAKVVGSLGREGAGT